MVNQYIWVGIAVGVFVAGIGIGYAVFVSTYNPITGMMNNPQMMNQWSNMMGSDMMNYMMNDPQMSQQMMGMMMQNNQFMQGMMMNPQFQQNWMMNNTGMMGSGMMQP